MKLKSISVNTIFLVYTIRMKCLPTPLCKSCNWNMHAYGQRNKRDYPYFAFISCEINRGYQCLWFV